MSEENRNKLRELLYLSDLVKFAKQQPLANENEGAMRASFEIIEATKLIVEPEEEVLES